MNFPRLAVAAALAASALCAHAAAPTAVLDKSFAEYAGSGPIGRNNVNANTFYWMFESSGTYAGHAVNSWFLIWDPSNARVRGSVSFDAPILFVHDDKTELNATAGFGKAGVAYDYGHNNVGLESADKTGTSFSGATLTLNWNASSPGDHVRVMTAVPEPQTYALMAAGLGAVGWVARRRRTR